MFEKERESINKLDEEMKRLFIERQETVAKIAKIKYENDMPIFDSKREEELKARLSRDLNDNDKKYYLAFLENILKLSKEYQKELIDKIKCE